MRWEKDNFLSPVSSPSCCGLPVLPLLPRHDHVPVVLYSVVSPTREQPRYERPLVAVEAVCRQETLLFFLVEGHPVYSWVQLVIPSQSATLP